MGLCIVLDIIDTLDISRYSFNFNVPRGGSYNRRNTDVTSGELISAIISPQPTLLTLYSNPLTPK